MGTPGLLLGFRGLGLWDQGSGCRGLGCSLLRPAVKP